MLAEPVAGALDLDDDGMVEQAIEQRRGDDGAAEDIAPFGKAAVRGQNHRAFLIARVDELEEQVAAAGTQTPWAPARKGYARSPRRLITARRQTCQTGEF